MINKTKDFSTKYHRLNINIPTSEHYKLKALVSLKGITLTDFIMGLIEKELEKKPNKQTIEAMKEIEENSDLKIYETVDEFYTDLGI